MTDPRQANQSNTPADKPVAESIGWQPISTEYPFRSPWFSLRSDRVKAPASDEPLRYSYVEHPGSVFIVPVTPDGNVLLIRSYRYPIDAHCWEVPAGQLQHGKSPADSARAELLEELGATCERLEEITVLQLANGFAAARSHFFLATGVRVESPPLLEPGESIQRTAAVPLPEAISMLTAEAQDGDSALAVLLAAHHLGEPTR
ncbi:MAG: NUDIX hydrolase [Planctomycetota bacterium]